MCLGYIIAGVELLRSPRVLTRSAFSRDPKSLRLRGRLCNFLGQLSDMVLRASVRFKNFEVEVVQAFSTLRPHIEP